MTVEEPPNTEINYVSPQEAIEEGAEPQHRFDLTIEGEKIGSAEFEYLSKPLPHYLLSDLYVEFEHKGKGYASKILEKMEEFLKERKKPGILVDAIMVGDPASDMYARRGWKEVPDSGGLHVFNWPDDVSLDVLKGYSFRYTDPMIREERKDQE